MVQGILILSMVLLTSFLAQAQTYTVKGRIVNDFQKEPVPGASVTANRIKDSTLVVATLADAEGFFMLEKIPVKDTLFMEVRSLGFKTFRASFFFKGSTPSMDSVFLVQDVTELEAVEVTAERPAMVTRGDTVEYNAASYQTRPYAEVKELINKLPGLYRDINGNLVFNGHKISKILVDGREYFGTDGEAALNAIPVDVVAKIQVMNDAEHKLKNPNAREEKMLNIQLKENVRMFGNGMGGGGTSGRYEMMGMMNYIKGNSRFAFRGAGNNTNITNYSGQSNAISMTTSGNGIIETWGGGVNYNRILGKNKSVSGNVNFNFPTSFNESVKSRTQFLVPDSSFFTDANSKSRNNGRNVSMSTTVDLKEQTYGNVQLGIQGLSYSTREGRSSNVTSTTGQDGTPVNRLENVLRGNSTRTNVPLSVNWNRRFGNNTNANVSWSSGWSNESEDNFNTGSTIFFAAVGVPLSTSKC